MLCPFEAPRQRPDVDLIDSFELALGNRAQHGHRHSSDRRSDRGSVSGSYPGSRL